MNCFENKGDFKGNRAFSNKSCFENFVCHDFL